MASSTTQSDIAAPAQPKPAGSTLPKRKPTSSHSPTVPAANVDDIESDEAVSSGDEEEDSADDEESVDSSPGIQMLVNGPIDEDDDDDDESFVDEPSSPKTKNKPSETENVDDAMAAATKSLDISGKKPGASLPTKEHVDLPERVDVNIDELAGSEESDEAESTGDESDENDSDDDSDAEGEKQNLTALLLGGSASDNEEEDSDDEEWTEPPRPRKGPVTRAAAKAGSKEQDAMNVDS